MSDKTLEEKVDVYKSLGFSHSNVWAIFKKWPFSLKFSEKKITQTFETLKRCGLLENEVLSLLKKNPQFLRISEKNIVNSIETFIGLGFTRDEFTMMIKRYPECIGFSAETVKKKTEFLVKEMNWPLEAVVSHPQVFGYSMEKRIVPRCNVIKALMAKGLLGEEGSELPSMSSLLARTDQVFLKRGAEERDEFEDWFERKRAQPETYRDEWEDHHLVFSSLSRFLFVVCTHKRRLLFNEDFVLVTMYTLIFGVV